MDPKIDSAPKVATQPSREVHNDPQLNIPVIDKGKQKEVENRSTDLVSGSAKGPQGMTLHEIEVERTRKENENLQRELEKAEIEALNVEFKGKIHFLKAPPIIFPPIDQSNFTSQHTSASLLNTQPMMQTNATPNDFVAPSSTIPTNQTSHGPSHNQSHQTRIAGSSGPRVNAGNNFTGNQFQRRPINFELYRQLYFSGIPGYPNCVPIEMRDRLQKFVGNNAISTEEHLKSFGDMINDYEIGYKDVIMKLFVQSLIENVRDWYRGLPVDSISSWEEFTNCFKEQYGDKTNVSFMLNKFNNIWKSDNEAVTDFNAWFKRTMHRLLQCMC